MSADQGEVQEAVYDLHQYLSDQKAPLMVADSVALLLQCPVKFLAAQVVAWVNAQAATAPVSDYLYHGAKKIFLLGEFELLPKEGLAEYLRSLCDELVQHCPPADQELLGQNLQRLGKAAPAVTVAAAGVLHRQNPEPKTTAEPVLTREVRRLSLLLEHLRPLASAPPEQRQGLASQFMTTAAVQSSSARELDDHLAPLRQLGINTATDQIFRTIARSLAGWALPAREGQQGPLVSREQLDAMRKIVSLAEDPAEAARRFREMVHAAIEQFNEGQLGRAATMFELAERLAVEKKVQAQFVDALRTLGHEYLDPERLRQVAERVDSRPQLRGVLNFFTALQPLGLLQALNGEPKRERRRQLLALLEVHEQAARSAAWELVQASVQQPGADPFFQMNLAYLLRIVPRPAGASVEAEVDVLMQTSGRTSPPPLVKQVIAYLANSRHDKAERALITYLRVFESMLVQPETAAYPAAELTVLLDRTCGALARYGTPRAWRALVDHGLKSDPRLGTPFARLVEAGRCDLSSSRDLVERLLAAIPPDLPRSGVLGMMGGKGNEGRAVALIQALAGTPLSEVRELLREIASKHATRKVGEAAVKALASLDSIGKPPPPPPGVSGDLELFGLPTLLQALGQSQFSGVLTLMDSRARPAATLLVEKGLFRGGQFGGVKGTEALYQLFERPFPGTFAFVSRADLGTQWHLGPQHDMIPLILEGVRRYDEFNRAAAVAPDHVRLKPTGRPRTTVANEDSAFATALWGQISPQKTVLDCETAMCVDSYRVRRVLAHWIEEGALQTA